MEESKGASDLNRPLIVVLIRQSSSCSEISTAAAGLWETTNVAWRAESHSLTLGFCDDDDKGDDTSFLVESKRRLYAAVGHERP